MKHHVVVIHGIGKAVEGYSKPLTDGIQRALKQAECAQEFVFHEFLWDDLVAIDQARLADALRKGFGLPPAGKPAGCLAKIFGAPKRWINSLRTDFVAQFIEDVLSYRDRTEIVYQMIHERLRSVFTDIARSEGEGVLSIIAHSLGTVIASDYIYDCQKKKETVSGTVPLRNFFTLGSPIALFSLQYGGVQLFRTPARVEDPSGCWLNILDKDDPIAYPLKTLNDAYNDAVSEDVAVGVGIFGLAHTKYFDNKKIHRLIAAKLVI